MKCCEYSPWVRIHTLFSLYFTNGANKLACLSNAVCSACIATKRPSLKLKTQLQLAFTLSGLLICGDWLVSLQKQKSFNKWASLSSGL
jgi:hypothetical protein